MATWSENLEELPRPKSLAQQGFTFSSPANARKGDLWSNPSAGQFGKLTIKYVTKWIDSDHEAIWYIVAFEDPTNLITALHIGEGMGMGTFEVPIKVNA
jgi:hypothetical protein